MHPDQPASPPGDIPIAVSNQDVVGANELVMAWARDRTTDVLRYICQKVKQWTGLPVCVGFGPSTTLANHVAKKRPEWNGMCDLTALVECAGCADWQPACW